MASSHATSYRHGLGHRPRMISSQTIKSSTSEASAGGVAGQSIFPPALDRSFDFQAALSASASDRRTPPRQEHQQSQPQLQQRRRSHQRSSTFAAFPTPALLGEDGAAEAAMVEAPLSVGRPRAPPTLGGATATTTNTIDGTADGTTSIPKQPRELFAKTISTPFPQEIYQGDVSTDLEAMVVDRVSKMVLEERSIRTNPLCHPSSNVTSTTTSTTTSTSTSAATSPMPYNKATSAESFLDAAALRLQHSPTLVTKTGKPTRGSSFSGYATCTTEEESSCTSSSTESDEEEEEVEGSLTPKATTAATAVRPAPRKFFVRTHVPQPTPFSSPNRGAGTRRRRTKRSTMAEERCDNNNPSLIVTNNSDDDADGLPSTPVRCNRSGGLNIPSSMPSSQNQFGNGVRGCLLPDLTPPLGEVSISTSSSIAAPAPTLSISLDGRALRVGDGNDEAGQGQSGMRKRRKLHRRTEDRLLGGEALQSLEDVFGPAASDAAASADHKRNRGVFDGGHSSSFPDPFASLSASRSPKPSSTILSSSSRRRLPRTSAPSSVPSHPTLSPKTLPSSAVFDQRLDRLAGGNSHPLFSKSTEGSLKVDMPQFHDSSLSFSVDITPSTSSKRTSAKSRRVRSGATKAPILK